MRAFGILLMDLLIFSLLGMIATIAVGVVVGIAAGVPYLLDMPEVVNGICGALAGVVAFGIALKKTFIFTIVIRNYYLDKAKSTNSQNLIQLP